MLAMTESRTHPDAYVELLYEEYQRPVLAYLTRLLSDREAAEDNGTAQYGPGSGVPVAPGSSTTPSN